MAALGEENTLRRGGNGEQEPRAITRGRHGGSSEQKDA